MHECESCLILWIRPASGRERIGGSSLFLRQRLTCVSQKQISPGEDMMSDVVQFSGFG
jgi:hypothetical protein